MVVLAHRDPGASNWLDTGSHRRGLLTYRWFWPRSDPSPRAEVVPFDELHDRLPEATPMVSGDERQRALRERKTHLAWRFRT